MLCFFTAASWCLCREDRDSGTGGTAMEQTVANLEEKLTKKINRLTERVDYQDEAIEQRKTRNKLNVKVREL